MQLEAGQDIGHPDYMDTTGTKCSRREKAIRRKRSYKAGGSADSNFTCNNRLII
jgi:hypothetical protein